jgi:hypothetical protein
MSSQIDETVPIFGEDPGPTTASVRANFATAKGEISALQNQTAAAPFLPLAGSHMTGPMYLYNDPTDVMMPATKGYVDAHGGSGGGGGGIPEAPADGYTYGRHQGAWLSVLKISGGTLTGMLTLSADPVGSLDAATKAYVDGAANQTITISGDASGSGAATIPVTLATVFSTPGTFQGLTIDAKGRIIAAANQNYAPLTNPAFAGIPTGPTAATATSSTQLATTAFVKNQGYTSGGPYLPTVGGVISGALTVGGNLQVDGSAQIVANLGVNGTATANQGVFDSGYRVYSQVFPPPGDLSVGGNLTAQGTVNGGQGVLDAGYRVYSPSNAPTDLTVTNNLQVNGSVQIGVNLGVTGSSNAIQGVFDASYRVYSPVNPPAALAALDAALADLTSGDLLLIEVGAEGEPIFRHAVLGPPDDTGQRAVLVQRG